MEVNATVEKYLHPRQPKPPKVDALQAVQVILQKYVERIIVCLSMPMAVQPSSGIPPH